QSQNGDTALDERLRSRQQAFCLDASLVGEPRREERPAAANGPAAIDRLENMDLITKPLQHLDSGMKVLRLEVSVECVGEQRDLSAGLAWRIASRGSGGERVGGPAGQLPFRGEAHHPLRKPSQ